MFQGTYTALVTPFREGKVDEEAFLNLIEKQIEGGVEGIVPVGTTGESPTLDHAEHTKVIQLAVTAARGRCKVIGGTGSNSTDEAISLTREAESAGVDGVLLVAPYYNKPTQEGLYRHFAAIAKATKTNIILYSIPGRCGVEIAVPTVKRLASEFSNIVAIKEAGGSVDRVSQLRLNLPDSFTILSGDDPLTIPFISVGAKGVISVLSNVIPAEISGMVRAMLKGDLKSAQTVHFKYYNLFKDMFLETNPVPVKAALAMMKIMKEEYRLPLCEMSTENRDRLRNSLANVGLI